MVACTLVFAGAVHTFPSLWAWWEILVKENPTAHYVIGGTALLLGSIRLFQIGSELVHNTNAT